MVKHQPNKMVKPTQTICRLLLECVWPFCDVGAQKIKGLFDYVLANTIKATTKFMTFLNQKLPNTHDLNNHRYKV